MRTWDTGILISGTAKPPFAGLSVNWNAWAIKSTSWLPETGIFIGMTE